MRQSIRIEIQGTYNSYLTHVGIRRYSKVTAVFPFEKWPGLKAIIYIKALIAWEKIRLLDWIDQVVESPEIKS